MREFCHGQLQYNGDLNTALIKFPSSVVSNNQVSCMLTHDLSDHLYSPTKWGMFFKIKKFITVCGIWPMEETGYGPLFRSWTNWLVYIRTGYQTVCVLLEFSILHCPLFRSHLPFHWLFTGDKSKTRLNKLYLLNSSKIWLRSKHSIIMFNKVTEHWL